MSLWERLVMRLRRIFRRKRRWYDVDMRAFVRAENARQWREVQS